MLLPVLAGAVGIGTVGHMENAVTFSPLQLVIDNELVRYVRRAIRTPWVVDEETLATELIDAVGPGGNYLSQTHTAEHFRDEVFLSPLFAGQSVGRVARQAGRSSIKPARPGRWPPSCGTSRTSPCWPTDQIRAIDADRQARHALTHTESPASIPSACHEESSHAHAESLVPRCLSSRCFMPWRRLTLIAQTESATTAASFGYLPEWPAGPPRELGSRLGRAGADPLQPLGRRPDRDGQGLALRLGRLQSAHSRLPLRDDQLVPACDDPVPPRRPTSIWFGSRSPSAFPSPPNSGNGKCSAIYIDQCHRQGIHVMAYESVANLFWEDMYQHVPESKHWVAIGRDGKPVPYGAGNYAKMGRITRYMADLANPQWRDYLKRRIDLAIEAGADGIMYDNCASLRLADTFQDLMHYALGRKKDFLIMANFHRHDFILNRLLNAITTEEGGEAGIFTDKTLAAARYRWPTERQTMRPRGRRIPGQQHRAVPHLREPLGRLEAGDDREPRPRGGNPRNARDDARRGTSS